MPRKSNMDQVLEAWINNQPAHMMSRDPMNTQHKWKTLNTDGESLFSYGLCIGTTTFTGDGHSQKQVLDHRVNDRMTVSTQRHIKTALKFAPVHPNYKGE